jgi:glutamate-ammonia-ligase adenylyltransferase
VLAARTIRRSELFRVAVADLIRPAHPRRARHGLTDLTEALIEVTLELCVRASRPAPASPALTRVVVVGMGRLGGGEQGYGSDADVLFVHDPVDGADEGAAQAQALEVVKDLIRLLGLRGPDPNLDIDADLRPEGKNGPLVRSLASYREYYDRWSLVWEAHALLRAKPIAGDADLGQRFLDLVDPIRWPAGGLDATQVREIRTLKARMEAERLPRGADRKTHFKLGHGGLSDVEWVVQLVQLQHAHAHPSCARPRRWRPCRRRPRLGLIDPDHATPRERRGAWRRDAQRRGALPRQDGGRRADRPARCRRHRAHPRPAPGLGPGAGGALPQAGSPGPGRPRGRVFYDD